MTPEQARIYEILLTATKGVEPTLFYVGQNDAGLSVWTQPWGGPIKLAWEQRERFDEALTPRRTHGPLARRTDPHTSHIAGREMFESGEIDTRVNAILSWMLEHPEPRTSREIGHESGIERHEVARRLKLMESEGLIKHVGFGVCSLSGRECKLWKAIPREAS